MATRRADDSAETVYHLNRISFISDIVYRRVASGVIRSIPEPLVRSIVRRGDALELAQVVISHRLDRALRLARRRRGLRARRGARVEVVLHVRTEAICIRNSRRISKRVAIHAVRE